MTAEERTALLILARNRLEALDDESVYERWRETRPPASLFDPAPCFVTLLQPNDRLRGCIGCLETEDALARNVFQLTRQAALRDPRFPPVEPEEAKKLSIHISVLGALRPLERLEDVELGRDGLVVEGDGKRGVLLADVATQYGWSREEFEQQTCLKAGLNPFFAKRYRWQTFPQESFGE